MKKKTSNFKNILKKYIDIKGLDIVVYLLDGNSIELNKNRMLDHDEIVVKDSHNREQRIPLASVKSIDLFAA